MGHQPHPYAVLCAQRLIGSYRRWCCLKAFLTVPVSAGKYNVLFATLPHLLTW